ncbi:MAG: glycerate kinase [Clostridiales bacterium]|nr:glycerate kinase [Clostridiales bacterium]
MKFAFAPDSFKGSLTALEIVELLEIAAGRHFPGALCLSVPVADGGEGTVDALLRACGGAREVVRVTGPLGAPVDAAFGLIDGGEAAVLEMAAASGLPLVRPEERDPLKATSFGTGEMMLAALSHGVRRLLIGIGGSATNDGGMGMLSALGARFFDADGNILVGSGAELARVGRVDFEGLSPLLKDAEITVICDVTNPLLGPDGATAIYGPQKGVTAELYPILEGGMIHYAGKLRDALGRDASNFPGSGAAGGMGAALGGVLGARMRPGIDAVLDAVGFDALLDGCDLAVTGEGRIDRQSVEFGKVPTGVARRCSERNVPVVALVGGIGDGADAFYGIGETSIFPIVNRPMPLEQAMADARALFADAADRLFRTLKIGMRLRG